MSSEAITRNDLKNILNEVLPVYSGAIHKVLYDSSKISSGTLTLSEPYTNFDYLVVSYFVNVDAYAQTFDCARLKAYPSHSYHGDIVIYNGSNVYASTCKFTVTDSTHFAVTNSGNNVNFIAGIVRIVGIKNPLVSAGITDLSDYIVEQGTSGIWTYRKWNSGIAECWGRVSVASRTYTANGGYYNVTGAPPTGLFVSGSNPVLSATGGITSNVQTNIGFTFASDSSIQTYLINRNTSAITNTAWVCWHLTGRWK